MSPSISQDSAPVEIETGRQPSASVIWLHGLGADGHDFEPIVDELQLPPRPAVRFVFPHAPFRPVTLNGGYVMRAWYDIAIEAGGMRQDATHIREAERAVRGLIDAEIGRGIESTRIVLAGFSQGAAVALHTGLRYPRPLAGILALSMPLPLPERIAEEMHGSNVRVPIFLAHGRRDPIVPFTMGQAAHRLLSELGADVEWHEYPMEHTVVHEEVRDIARWLERVLNASREL